MENIHRDFIDKVKNVIIQDDRFKGLLAGGSMKTGEMDKYSDIDLVLVYDEQYSDIMNERLLIAKKFGNLLSGFTGEHVGEPRLVICMYADPLLHVDLKFITLDELENRVEDPLIIWEENYFLSSVIKRTKPFFPSPSLQWIEDRFWVWIHYGATKLGRGELFELIEHITFIRGTVLGPLALMESNQPPSGVRKIEQKTPEYLNSFVSTIPKYDRESCYEALQATILLYKQLRLKNRDYSTLQKNIEAEKASINYLKSIMN